MADLSFLPTKFSRRNWVGASEQHPSIASHPGPGPRHDKHGLASVIPLRPRGGVALVLVSSNDEGRPVQGSAFTNRRI